MTKFLWTGESEYCKCGHHLETHYTLGTVLNIWGDCKRFYRCDNFTTNLQHEYEHHVAIRHPGKPGYRGLADLEIYGLRSQKENHGRRNDSERQIQVYNKEQALARFKHTA